MSPVVGSQDCKSSPLSSGSGCCRPPFHGNWNQIYVLALWM